VVHVVQPEVVDVQPSQRLRGDGGVDVAVGADLSVVRTRRNSRFAIRGVPRDRRAISAAPSLSIGTFRIAALRRMIVAIASWS
jgi:hypothetical protein